MPCKSIQTNNGAEKYQRLCANVQACQTLLRALLYNYAGYSWGYMLLLLGRGYNLKGYMLMFPRRGYDRLGWYISTGKDGTRVDPGRCATGVRAVRTPCIRRQYPVSADSTYASIRIRRQHLSKYPYPQTSRVAVSAMYPCIHAPPGDVRLSDGALQPVMAASPHREGSADPVAWPG